MKTPVNDFAMSKESHRDTLRKETHWERRDRKYRKRRYGMRVSGRSVKAVLLPLVGRKAEDVKKGEKSPSGKRRKRRRKKRR